MVINAKMSITVAYTWWAFCHHEKRTTFIGTIIYYNSYWKIAQPKIKLKFSSTAFWQLNIVLLTGYSLYFEGQNKVKNQCEKDKDDIVYERDSLETSFLFLFLHKTLNEACFYLDKEINLNVTITIFLTM